jgi:hypothetical protein
VTLIDSVLKKVRNQRDAQAFSALSWSDSERFLSHHKFGDAEKASPDGMAVSRPTVTTRGMLTKNGNLK